MTHFLDNCLQAARSSNRSKRDLRSKPRHQRLTFETLEGRQLLSGCPTVAPSPAIAVPELHSNFGAPTSVYLDFDGHCEPNFFAGRDAITPPFQSSGRPGKTQDQIVDVWEHVAEDFAPFNVNVTTVEPAGRYLRVVIGGLGTDWLGNANINGVAFGHAFTPGNRNVVHVFERQHGSGKHVADTASHEAGHAFRLGHQVVFSGNTTSPNYGSNSKAPIMGHSHASDRSTWWAGKTDSGQIQYDVSVLNRLIGPRADDHGGDVHSATRLDQVQSFRPFIGTLHNRLSGSGIIETHLDRDLFAFTVRDTGEVTVNVNVGVGIDVDQRVLTDAGNANLDLELTIRTASGTAVAHIDTGSLGESFDTDAVPLVLPNMGPLLQVGNTYYIDVSSHGYYGDLGNYTVTVDGPVGVGPSIIDADLLPTNVGGPSRPVHRVVERMLVTFDQPIDLSTIDSSDVKLFDPQGTQIAAKSVIPLNAADPDTFEITFPTQSLSGDYQVIIGPDIRGANQGCFMDQDRDGKTGELLEDRFIFGFSIRGGYEDLRDSDRKLDILETFKVPGNEPWPLPGLEPWAEKSTGGKNEFDSWEKHKLLDSKIGRDDLATIEFDAKFEINEFDETLSVLAAEIQQAGETDKFLSAEDSRSDLVSQLVDVVLLGFYGK